MNGRATLSQRDPMKLFYLGPEGTFTHQAALYARSILSQPADGEVLLCPLDTASDIIDTVSAGEGLGVLAWDNNVQGTVIPNMDALIDAQNVAGFCKIRVDVVFEAFVRPQHGKLTEVCAHPHGLAQCKSFIHRHALEAIAASSNAAACRDLGANQVGLGPRICGELYGLETLESSVQDFASAHTDFLLLAQRQQARILAEQSARSQFVGSLQQMKYESVIALIPLQTGSGVLAGLLDLVRDAGLNMTSFMSRPVKGQNGMYSFIATVDAAPWENDLSELLKEFVDHGVWIKTLAVFPRVSRSSSRVDQWMLPVGGVSEINDNADATSVERVRKELLW